MKDTRALRDRDRRFVWHPYTRRSSLDGEFPVIESGEGVYLRDTDGRRYFDAVSSWWACNLGHGHPKVAEAISKQSRVLQHSILGNMSHPCAIELAEGIAGLFPRGGRHVLFGSDGSSAVEAALKVAVQYRHNRGESGREVFVSFEDAYHGDTIGSVSLGFLEGFHRPFRSLVFRVFRVESPCCRVCRHGKQEATCGLECFASMEKTVRENSAGITGVVVESLCQGAAGMRIYSPKYLERLAMLCRETGILLIADEIAMGMGRTGKMFAFDHARIDPDITCMGKGLSAGSLPISATVVKDSIYDSFSDSAGPDRTFFHGHTFAGNPIAAAAAVATLDVYRSDGIVEMAAVLGERMARSFNTMEGMSCVRTVRHAGAVAAIELDDGGGTGVALAGRVRERLMSDGILVRPLGNVVYMMPPLVTDGETIDWAVDCLRAAIRAG